MRSTRTPTDPIEDPCQDCYHGIARRVRLETLEDQITKIRAILERDTHHH